MIFWGIFISLPIFSELITVVLIEKLLLCTHTSINRYTETPE